MVHGYFLWMLFPYAFGLVDKAPSRLGRIWGNRRIQDNSQAFILCQCWAMMQGSEQRRMFLQVSDTCTPVAEGLWPAEQRMQAVMLLC